MKGATFIAEFLVKEKIPYVFGICGHGNVGLLDGLYEVRDRIKLVAPRHEQVAGHMADGFFRVKHRPVATLTSTGPGSANLIKPCLIDVHVDANIRPPGTGAWALPPILHKEPVRREIHSREIAVCLPPPA